MADPPRAMLAVLPGTTLHRAAGIAGAGLPSPDSTAAEHTSLKRLWVLETRHPLEQTVQILLAFSLLGICSFFSSLTFRNALPLQ